MTPVWWRLYAGLVAVVQARKKTQASEMHIRSLRSVNVHA
jgi:hypothetical protein